MNEGLAKKEADRLFWAACLAVVTAGMGFALRGGVLLQWAGQYGFTLTELGEITGCGLTGFGVVMIVFAFAARRVGARGWLAGAFVLDLICAVVILSAGTTFAAGKIAVFHWLALGLFIFSAANGFGEGAAYLLATASHPNKSRRMGIFSASWPAGMFLGASASAFLHHERGGAVSWQIQMALFLVPAIAYGALLIGTPSASDFARTEPITKPIRNPALTSFFILATLVLLQAIQGWVEFGVTSWLSTIDGRIFSSPRAGLLVLAYLSALLAVVRPFSSAIQKRISPLHLLLAGAALSCLALMILGHTTSLGIGFAGATLYFAGTAFTWATLLSMASALVPGRPAVIFAIMSAAGMLTAGLLAAPALGYAQETHAVRNLMAEHPEIYARYKSPGFDHVLFFYTTTLDPIKVQAAKTNPAPSEDKTILTEAQSHGGRVAFRMTAALPALQFVLILGLIILGPAPRAIKGS